jgi:hypothetical protein
MRPLQSIELQRISRWAGPRGAEYRIGKVQSARMSKILQPISGSKVGSRFNSATNKAGHPSTSAVALRPDVIALFAALVQQRADALVVGGFRG